jgi:hypothetical protein
MSKFNVGDKVRVVKAKDDGSPTTKEFIGKEGVVNQTGGYFGYNVKFADDVWAFYPDELEAADPTPEARLEQAKALVAEIEQEIEDAKPKAQNIPVGSVAKNARQHPGHFVKVAHNAWVTVSVQDGASRSDEVVVIRDWSMNDWGFEIIREGV